MTGTSRERATRSAVRCRVPGLGGGTAGLGTRWTLARAMRLASAARMMAPSIFASSESRWGAELGVEQEAARADGQDVRPVAHDDQRAQVGLQDAVEPFAQRLAGGDGARASIIAALRRWASGDPASADVNPSFRALRATADALRGRDCSPAGPRPGRRRRVAAYDVRRRPSPASRPRARRRRRRGGRRPRGRQAKLAAERSGSRRGRPRPAVWSTRPTCGARRRGRPRRPPPCRPGAGGRAADEARARQAARSAAGS